METSSVMVRLSGSIAAGDNRCTQWKRPDAQPVFNYNLQYTIPLQPGQKATRQEIKLKRLILCKLSVVTEMEYYSVHSLFSNQSLIVEPTDC